MLNTKSPCTLDCCFESWIDKKVQASEKEICISCKRTKHEIRTWPYMTDEEKDQTNKRLNNIME